MDRRLQPWLMRAVLAGITALLAGCATVPAPSGRTPSTAFQDTAGTRIGRTVAELSRGHAGESGVFALAQGVWRLRNPDQDKPGYLSSDHRL